MADMLYLPGGETLAVFGDREDFLAGLLRDYMGSDAERLFRSVCKECRGMADELQDELDSRNAQITRYLCSLRVAKHALEQLIESQGAKSYGIALSAKHKIQQALMGL